MLAPAPRKLTIAQFLYEYQGVEGRYELEDGEVVAMTGGTVAHARVSGSIFNTLSNALRGSSCQPFNSDMGLQTTPSTVRYPDVAIYCNPRDLERDGSEQVMAFPKVIFEVLSPSTMIKDRALKLLEYKALDSVMTIVFVHPIARSIEVHRRTGALDWQQVTLPPGEDLVLDDPAVRLPFSDIFAGS